MKTLALDPGIRGCGVALFAEGRLVACDYVKNPVTKGDDFDAIVAMGRAVRDWRWVGATMLGSGHGFDLVAEYPRIYTAAKSKGDNNDLLPLVGVGAAVATFASSAVRVFPDTWKKQLPKDVCHARIRSRLDAGELVLLEAAAKRAKSLAHNMVDAVGIGLHHVGRFAPKKAYEVT